MAVKTKVAKDSGYDPYASEIVIHSPVYHLQSEAQRKKADNQLKKAQAEATRGIIRRKNRGSSGGHGF